MHSLIDKQVHINKLTANPALCMLPRLYNTITNPTNNYNKRREYTATCIQEKNNEPES